MAVNVCRVDDMVLIFVRYFMAHDRFQTMCLRAMVMTNIIRLFLLEWLIEKWRKNLPNGGRGNGVFIIWNKMENKIALFTSDG